MFFAVLHTGIKSVSPAHMIDERYAELFYSALEQGVEALAYSAEIDTHQVYLNKVLPIAM